MKASWFVSSFGTQAKLAAALGVSRPSVNRYVKADAEIPPSWIGLLYLNKAEGRPALERYEAEHEQRMSA